MFHRKNIIYIPIFYFREYINFLVNKHHLISALTHNYSTIEIATFRHFLKATVEKKAVHT